MDYFGVRKGNFYNGTFGSYLGSLRLASKLILGLGL